MNNGDFLEIDGSFGEGGGAILRLSAGFSVLYNKPIRIKNIRANRPKPGLRLQHLLGLKTLAELTSSRLSDCKIGSREISFIPNNQVNDNIFVEVDTAASIGLLLQPIQIASLGFEKPKKIEISLKGGGTFGKWAPSLNYLQNVTYPIFEQSGLKIEIDIHKYGWYPKGGALTDCRIYPSENKLKPLNLTELGNVDIISGEIVITNQLKQTKKDIPQRILNSIKKKFKSKINNEIDIKILWVDSLSTGVGISLWASSDTGAIISTGTILGERTLSSEQLGMMAANELIKYIGNNIPVDNHLSDQLIPLMAYIKKQSCIKVFEITSHTKTNLDLISLFTNRKYSIDKEHNSFLIKFYKLN